MNLERQVDPWKELARHLTKNRAMITGLLLEGKENG
jgi:hypothetical protein